MNIHLGQFHLKKFKNGFFDFKAKNIQTLETVLVNCKIYMKKMEKVSFIKTSTRNRAGVWDVSANFGLRPS